MKKTVLMLCMALFTVATLSAQDKPYSVVFYNLENLWADAKLTYLPDID